VPSPELIRSPVALSPPPQERRALERKISEMEEELKVPPHTVTHCILSSRAGSEEFPLKESRSQRVSSTTVPTDATHVLGLIVMVYPSLIWINDR